MLLTDLVMPGAMTGKDLADQLCAEKPSLKVIFTSGHASDAIESEFPLEEGLNYLGKPYSPQSLSAILRRNFDRG